MTLTRWKLLVVIGRKSECRKKRRDRKGYIRVERRVHKAGWMMDCCDKGGRPRTRFLFPFQFFILPLLSSRHAQRAHPWRDATLLPSIDRSIWSIRGYRGEYRGACSLLHDKCVAFLRVIALLRGMHASIFNIDHNVRVRAAERPGRIYPFHAGYLGNRHQIIRRGFVNGNENVYIMSRGSRRGRKVFNCYKDFIN